MDFFRSMFYFLSLHSIVIFTSAANKKKIENAYCAGSHHHQQVSHQSKSTDHRGFHDHHHVSHQSKSTAHQRNHLHVSSRDRSKSMAQEMCKKYTKQTCDQNLSSRRLRHSQRSFHYQDSIKYIVGGKLSKPKEFPFMALLSFDKVPGYMWLCGGSLISDRFVLTVGHCGTDPTPTWIRLGEYDWTITTDDAKTLDYKVLEAIVHPNFDSTTYHNNITLLRFEGLSAFTDYIRPICLNVFEDIPDTKFIAAGWGRTTYKGFKSPELRSVELDRQSNEKCRSIYHSDFVAETMLCVGNAFGQKDTCHGDSGGPLFISNEAECSRVPVYTQVGITSQGRECGDPNKPALYTKISYYIPWIENIVWSNN